VTPILSIPDVERAISNVARASSNIVFRDVEMEFVFGKDVGLPQQFFIVQPKSQSLDFPQSWRMGSIEKYRKYECLVANLQIPPTPEVEREIGLIRLHYKWEGGTAQEEKKIILSFSDREEMANMKNEKVEQVFQTFSFEKGGKKDTSELIEHYEIMRDLYIQEKRDPKMIELLEKTIESLKAGGNLAGLNQAESDTLSAMDDNLRDITTI
jgi:hypothetical protein